MLIKIKIFFVKQVIQDKNAFFCFIILNFVSIFETQTELNC